MNSSLIYSYEEKCSILCSFILHGDFQERNLNVKRGLTILHILTAVRNHNAVLFCITIMYTNMLEGHIPSTMKAKRHLG